jgi:toxin ParE1/3/4
MAYQIIVTAKAERDLENIRDFIARDNPDAADTFCAELVREAKALRTFPHRAGTFAKRPNIRKIPYQSYLIFYKTIEKNQTIEILRFWHSARDQDRLRLKEEPSQTYSTSPGAVPAIAS